MYSGVTILVPANTARSDPSRTTITLSWGLIDYFAYYIPLGSTGLTHFVVNYHARQLYPFDVDEDFSLCGQLVEYRPRTPIRRLPYDIEVVAWNEDDAYGHHIYIHLGEQRTDLIEVFGKLTEGA